ncbi:MAG: hypothetical protein ACYTFM_08925 [Planctomycetota bacterium]|jgi:hypothetical protein
MAPPVSARLNTATGDLRYQNFINTLWWDTTEFLYDSDVEKIKKGFGDFILIDTNFNHVNAFMPVQNLFKPLEKPATVTSGP